MRYAVRRYQRDGLNFQPCILRALYLYAVLCIEGTDLVEGLETSEPSLLVSELSLESAPMENDEEPVKTERPVWCR